MFINILIFFVMGQVTLSAKEVSFLKQKDKQLHMMLSAAIATAVTGYARNQGSSKVEAFFYGAGAAIATGLIKEGIDGNRDGGTQSWGDVAADMIGGTAGALISAQFEWKF